MQGCHVGNPSVEGTTHGCVFCLYYKFSGIPTYFVVNTEGKITYQKMSFPGVEKLKEDVSAILKIHSIRENYHVPADKHNESTESGF